jgi:hypothetical protein
VAVSLAAFYQKVKIGNIIRMEMEELVKKIANRLIREGQNSV